MDCMVVVGVDAPHVNIPDGTACGVSPGHTDHHDGVRLHLKSQTAIYNNPAAFEVRSVKVVELCAIIAEPSASFLLSGSGSLYQAQYWDEAIVVSHNNGHTRSFHQATARCDPKQPGPSLNRCPIAYFTDI
jgi:hypothetical protein